MRILAVLGALALGLVGCRFRPGSGAPPAPPAPPPAPRLVVGALADPDGLDAFLAAHPRGDAPVRIDRVARTPGASYSLVQLAAAEEPHRHRRHDLTVLVLRGDGVLTLDGVRVALRAGDAAAIPRNHVHWFAPTEGTTAVSLAIYTPPLDGKDFVPAKPR
jgi:quercetin dioxygenase-like cupin family protein